MSQTTPAWYPDPSGRFAQRYHDGNRWTEHVLDAGGNRNTDAPVASPAVEERRPAPDLQHSAAGAVRRPDHLAEGGGAAAPVNGVARAAPSDPPAAGRSGHEQVSPQPMPSRFAPQAPGGDGVERAFGTPPIGADGGAPSTPSAPSAPSFGSSNAPSAPTAPAFGATGSPIGAGPEAAHSPRTWEPREGAGDDRGAPGVAASSGFAVPKPGDITLTLGLLAAVAGAGFVVLSLVLLPFQSFSLGEFGSGSLSLNEAGSGDASFVVEMYASLGRMMAAWVLVGAVLATVRVPQLAVLQRIPNLGVIVAGVCGMMAFWHLLAMFLGDGTSPHIGGFIGLLGWIGLAAAQFFDQPLTSKS
ncbi:MAG: DUF2510 domain-containing protein [Actinomycetota bacterium]|nr:DUF2510 domain-containing protein [Actinomycetota bacterium]